MSKLFEAYVRYREKLQKHHPALAVWVPIKS